MWLVLAALVAAAASIQTTHKCFFDGAWGDVCRYENICFNGANQLIFVTDKPSELWHRGGQANLVYTTRKTFKTIDGLPNASRTAPLHYKLNSRHRVVSTADYKAGALGNNVVWSNRTTWIPSYFETLGNIWFYSTRVLPLFTARMYADQWDLPPMQDVLLYADSHITRHSWHAGMLNLSISRDARVYHADEEPYKGLADNIWCFKRAVLLGSNMFGFPDMVSAYEFRRLAYERIGTSVPKSPAPPAQVTILDRGPVQPRRFSNVADMMGVIAKYNISVQHVIITGTETFEEQVRLMSQTGLLISMHGAGLMNTIFLPPDAAVIEIFPVHVKHVLYERVAHYAGVYHFKVYSRQFANGYHTLHPDYIRLNCDAVASMSISDNGDCWRLLKNSNVVTPLPEFEVAFVHALDTIGVRTKLRGPATYSDTLEDRSLVDKPKNGAGALRGVESARVSDA